jgi:chemotaxis protein methyltransferase CheR
MALAADIVAAIAGRLAEHAGLELPAWVIDARASARIAAIGCAPAEYVALIGSARGAGELAALIEAVRVGETRLFRHQAQIDVLTTVFAPAMRARGRQPVRVWSAGCAAGEEPYTLAIVLSRALPGSALSILATDVSQEALSRARSASYPRAALDHVPVVYRDCFIADGDTVRVAPEIARSVRFERANLVDGAAPRDCDLVWCRNVLIYFTAEARRRAIERLVAATVPGGFVFVGYSESLRDIDGVEARSAGDTVFYVRTGATVRARPPTPPVPLVVPATLSARRSAPSLAPGDRTPPPSRVSVDRTPPPALVAADRTPPAIAVSADPSRVEASTPSTLALRGQPTAVELAAEISARFALPGLTSLTIDLDGAELLDDDLVPVLRRARAAASTAGVGFGVAARRPGAVRWLNRHGFGDSDAIVAEDAQRSRRPSGGRGPASES